jgi:uncharacterized protein (DUF1800 family)
MRCFWLVLRRRSALPWWAWPLLCALQGCGGGGGGGSGAPDTGSRSVLNVQPISGSTGIEANATEQAASVDDAHRFLRQATFGPSTTSVSELMGMSYGQWVDAQYAMSVQSTHLDTIAGAAADMGPGARNPDGLTYSWWSHALSDPAQLRHRVAFALSEIFVVSSKAVQTETVASYLDMLTQNSGARFRDLLEGVALHPAMGQYLSHLGNRKEDPGIGRVPDENFAREVMQLFTIGLYELDDSGQARGGGIETYTASDVQGLARVFTGWSWARSLGGTAAAWWECFWRTASCVDDQQSWANMAPYAEEHATGVKQFLGVTVPAQASADPRASLKAALDRLAQHPNAAPFITRQLIQKLVTSNPSPTYIHDVVLVWRATDGNLQAVVRAILLHDEARHPQRSGVDMQTYGKVNEPLLRLAQLLRALHAQSDTHIRLTQAGAMPYMLAVDSDNVGAELAQTPMRANSVFNFYRPTFSPPLSQLAQRGLVAPEMQLSTETTTLAYANFVRQMMSYGWGQWNARTHRCDIQFDLGRWQGLAPNPPALVASVAPVLLGHAVANSQATVMVQALNAMPANTPEQQLERVRASILMLAVTPDFIVQR